MRQYSDHEEHRRQNGAKTRCTDVSRSRSRSRSSRRSRHGKHRRTSHSSSKSKQGSPTVRRARANERNRSRSRRRSTDKSSPSPSEYRRHSRDRRVPSPHGEGRSGNRGRRDNPEPSRCIGVFGLNPQTTESAVRRFFERFGKIERAQMVFDTQTDRSRGFCFLYFRHFRDACDAKNSCTGIEIEGRRIRVDYSITRRPHTPTPGVYMGRRVRRPYGSHSREREGRERDERRSRRHGRSCSRTRSRRHSPTRSRSRSASRRRY